MFNSHSSFLLFLLFLCSSVCVTVQARDTLVAASDSDSLITDSSKLIVRMERRDIQNRAIYDTLAITVQAVNYPIAGFDLCFGTGSPYIDIVEVLPGEIMDSCKWEYFTTKQLPTEQYNGSPRVLWKAVGLAEMIPDSSRPKCYGLKREVSLVQVVVSNKHVLNMPQTGAAIYFFWTRCTDNSISNSTGTTLALSSSVLDYIEPETPDTSDSFPTRKGTPKICVNPAKPNKPVRVIQFHNGGINFAYAATEPASKTNQPTPALIEPKTQAEPVVNPK